MRFWGQIVTKLKPSSGYSPVSFLKFQVLPLLLRDRFQIILADDIIPIKHPPGLMARNLHRHQLGDFQMQKIPNSRLLSS